MCYDVKNGKQQYDIAAYPRTEQEKFQNTSLILRGKNGFYQLRNGSKGGFFHFDLHKRAWEKLMETEYTLNTLMISADEKAPLHAHLEDPKGQRPCYRNQYDFPGPARSFMARNIQQRIAVLPSGLI